ncbi:hypothetical protein NW768_007333 [Fusarium equiseti]|uniref:Sorbose reductase sou1 n=1 Tax=Fusarium equiseti TaxID=61235 RepID=A0ABQ8R772_FUSEQ|nr:hypothetical protein NW768_007333 [Fusarium equiseti]
MAFADLAVYLLGIGCIIRSIMAFTNPQAEYAINGLKHDVTHKDDSSSGPIYMLGLWELIVGMLLLASQATGAKGGVTILLVLMSLYKTGVAVLLSRIGDDNKMSKVLANLGTAFILFIGALRM